MTSEAHKYLINFYTNLPVKLSSYEMHMPLHHFKKVLGMSFDMLKTGIGREPERSRILWDILSATKHQGTFFFSQH